MKFKLQKVQTGLQKLRAEVVPELKREINRGRLEGDIVPYEVVPFPNGDDPTQPPHNLPHLVSVEVIEQLSECQLISYLTGYGTNPMPTGPNPGDTDYLRRDHLMALVGVQG